jgi:hypothetical protein
VVGPVGGRAQAVALTRREALDGAILDVRLRDDERSYAIADELIGRGIPFLFCTAYGKGEIAPDYERRPTLRKPFTQASLAAALTRLLAQPQPRSRGAGGGRGSLSS